MEFSPISLLASLSLFALSIYIYGRVQNHKRLQSKSSYRLIPNCLLTRFPVVLLAGKESAFYNGNYYNFIPNALRDHGYEILEFHPIGKGQERLQDIQSFLKILKDENLSCHWICLPSDLQDLQKLNKLYPECFKSLQTAEHDNKHAFNLNLFLHKIMTGQKLNPFIIGTTFTNNEIATLRFYLEKLRNLAEQDYQQHEEHHDQLHSESPRT